MMRFLIFFLAALSGSLHMEALHLRSSEEGKQDELQLSAAVAPSRTAAESNIWAGKFSLSGARQGLVDLVPKSWTGTKAALADKLNATAEEPLWYYHLHIPKAAGTAMAFELQHRWNLDHVTSLEGCFEFGEAHLETGKYYGNGRTWAREQPGKRTIVLFRDPVPLTRSLYNHCATSPEMAAVRKAGMTKMPEEMDEWLEYWSDSLEKDKHHSGFTSKKFYCYKPIDFQASRMTCQLTRKCEADVCNTCKKNFKSMTDWFKDEKTCNDETTGELNQFCRDAKTCEDTNKVDGDRAVANMQNAFHVGVTELYQESMCVLHAKVYETLPEYCNCENEKAWNGYSTDSKGKVEFRHGNAATETAIATEAQTRLVEKITQQDIKLYKAAVDRLKKDAKAIEAKHGVKIMCEHRVKSFHERHPRSGAYMGL